MGEHISSCRPYNYIFILALRLELVSSLPDCRGLFAVIRVHVVMPERSHQTFIVVYRLIVGHRTPPVTHTCQ